MSSPVPMDNRRGDTGSSTESEYDASRSLRTYDLKRPLVTEARESTHPKRSIVIAGAGETSLRFRSASRPHTLEPMTGSVGQ